jgi:hypothetical protein
VALYACAQPVISDQYQTAQLIKEPVTVHSLLSGFTSQQSRHHGPSPGQFELCTLTGVQNNSSSHGTLPLANGSTTVVHMCLLCLPGISSSSQLAAAHCTTQA